MRGIGFFGMMRTLHGRLRIHIHDGEEILLLVDDLRGDFPPGDFLKESHGEAFRAKEPLIKWSPKTKPKKECLADGLKARKK